MAMWMSPPAATGGPALAIYSSAVKPWILIVSGAAFVAVTSFFAPERAWIEAVSESFVPYGVVPLAVGYAAQRSRVAPVALLGAGASVAMVMAFYFARPLLDPPYGVLWEPLLYWSLVGAMTGALLAVFAWWLRPRVRAHETPWAVGAWLILAFLPVIYFAYTGWGRIDVATSSGTVTIGFSTADVIIASVVLAAFSGGVVLAATRERSWRATPTPASVR